MRNRDMPAKPQNFTGADDYESGLTKLEYAAIQIFSRHCKDLGGGDVVGAQFAVNAANALFDKLEQE